MTTQTRREWMAMLGKLTAPMDAATAAKGLADMLPLLADHPEAAFTTASLKHVATKCRKVPTYGDLDALLGRWWRDHRPPSEQPAPVVARIRHETLTERLQRAPSQAEVEASRRAFAEAAPTPEALAAVRRIVAAFEAERSFHRPHAVHVEQQPPRPKPAHLTPEQLQAANKQRVPA